MCCFVFANVFNYMPINYCVARGCRSAEGSIGERTHNARQLIRNYNWCICIRSGVRGGMISSVEPTGQPRPRRSGVLYYVKLFQRRACIMSYSGLVCLLYSGPVSLGIIFNQTAKCRQHYIIHIFKHDYPHPSINFA